MLRTPVRGRVGYIIPVRVQAEEQSDLPEERRKDDAGRAGRRKKRRRGRATG